ncbi:uncharacterized protein BDCG_00193 [Blastomyces dermatitidis ER-3]|uniref:HAM1-like N-terminal domain-containing protein n=1 Tax=Ajellomyces dermatitidis (strain ER-3 / ATCC MYA-2586) TaxID=559297 RepID=A0ABP2ELI7_AJEDR|nr:uncharacterized protein BDCG_00193 [Blastomyces dermatitidis ER-3]EEQ83388.1 hypothetical protein BDCG_00193 [Blastomyces dermatitidis ER-3]EQL35925.1 hypothetical protein BDFG_02526 [Blastomyces dermatitidis ATCC 26199]
MWSSCCKSRKATSGETQPLLPQNHDYDEDTALQRQLHEKLRTYQMLKAVRSGYMPSTAQVVSHLHVLLVSSLLNPEPLAIGNTSRGLIKDVKLCISLLINLLQEKNGDDQLQNAIWQLSKSTVEVDTASLASRGAVAKAQANTTAARESIRTVAGLLLTNSDFRRLVDDLATIGRMIFADTASALSSAAADVAEEVEPSDEERAKLQPGNSESKGAPSSRGLRHDLEQVSGSAREAVAQTGKAAAQSTEENVVGHYKSTLLYRVKKTVQSLRKRDDYTTSVSSITKLIKQYGIIYSRAVDETANAAVEEVEENSDLKQAVQNLWDLVGSFGDRKEWQLVERKFYEVVKHSESDPEFESLLKEIGNSIQGLFTDPGFFDSADETVELLKQKSRDIGPDSALRQDVDAFLQQLGLALSSVLQDNAVAKLLTVAKKLGGDLSRAFHDKAPAVSEDALNVLLPTLIRSIQHIPIPRLEVSTPELDLLLENVVLEPGSTFRSSSFFPWKVLVTTRNDLEIQKAHSKAAHTTVKNVVTITMNGLNISAKDFGYWIRVHSPPYISSSDEGIASFTLDERGIDISLDLEIGRDRIERLVSLLAVRVHIHKLDYTVRKSTWSFMWWVLKPFLKHMIRRVLEKKIAEKIVAAAHILNRELVFARERLRATRICSPQSLATFARAILTSLSPKMDPDVYTRVGLDAHRQGIFKDVYTPASVMKIWNVEGQRAGEAVEDGDQSGGVHMTWRNDVFDAVSSSPRTFH